MTQHDYFISMEMNGQPMSTLSCFTFSSHQQPQKDLKSLQAAAQPSLASPPTSGYLPGPQQASQEDVQTQHGYDVICYINVSEKKPGNLNDIHPKQIQVKEN